MADYFCFVDRELSWLQFNMRVLKEAGDKTTPLFERLKFLSIYYSNLDEFFMVRVGTLVHRAKLMPDYHDEKTGWDVDTQLKKVLSTVSKQQEKAEEIYKKLVKDMSDEGIDILDFSKTSKVEESMAKKAFSEIRHQISPIIIDEDRDFPFIQNNETYVAAILEKRGKSFIGLVPLSRLPKYRVFEVKGRQKVAFISDIVMHFAHQLSKKYSVREVCTFKVIRNADIFLEENQNNDDFRERMTKLLRKRKREQPVRLVIYGSPSIKMSNLLATKINVASKFITSSLVPDSLSFGSIINKKDNQVYDTRKPIRNVMLKKGEYFDYLEKDDMLLSFPYQSITPFIDLIYEAADDPEVTSIKITLYRLAAPSKLAAALAYAADAGKDVLCLLELRARFDEQNNIDYSEMLETAGCRIIYGLDEMKVHSKVCLITRMVHGGKKYITQIGTGNYNEITSEQYSDLSLITSDKNVGMDAETFFDELEKGEIPSAGGDGLIIAPNGFKPWLLNMLDSEIAKGADGFVSIKVNSLNDIDVMNKLIECSQAGVKVELFVRGICCLRPGIEGFTENITIKSIVGRYLEHSRIYIFGQKPRVFIGSGDLLNRNTRRRVEAFVEVKSKSIKEQVIEIMDEFRNDGANGSYMLSDGKYKKGDEPSDSQDRLYSYFLTKIVKKRKRGLFGWLSRIFG